MAPALKFSGERFNLDDVSTQAGQQLRGVGECLHLLDGEHTDSFKGPARCSDCSRLCPGELHCEYYIRSA